MARLPPESGSPRKTVAAALHPRSTIHCLLTANDRFR